MAKLVNAFAADDINGATTGKDTFGGFKFAVFDAKVVLIAAKTARDAPVAKAVVAGEAVSIVIFSLVVALTIGSNAVVEAFSTGARCDIKNQSIGS